MLTYSDVCISTLKTWFDLHVRSLALSLPLLTRSCSAKARARWNESVSEGLKASEEPYETHDALIYTLSRFRFSYT